MVREHLTLIVLQTFRPLARFDGHGPFGFLLELGLAAADDIGEGFGIVDGELIHDVFWMEFLG